MPEYMRHSPFGASAKRACGVTHAGKPFVVPLYGLAPQTASSAIATYKGSLKKFFIAIAMQLRCPTDDDRDKPMTVDALKEEILVNSNENTLLIFPEAKRNGSTSIRYWLEDMISAGARVVCFAVPNPGRDIFLDMLEIELALPSDAHIRLVMAAEAQRVGLKIG